MGNGCATGDTVAKLPTLCLSPHISVCPSQAAAVAANRETTRTTSAPLRRWSTREESPKLAAAAAAAALQAAAAVAPRAVAVQALGGAATRIAATRTAATRIPGTVYTRKELPTCCCSIEPTHMYSSSLAPCHFVSPPPRCPPPTISPLGAILIREHNHRAI